MEQFPEISEALRRRANLGASGAGVQGGMKATNAPNPASNPVAQQGQNMKSNEPAGFPDVSGGAQATPQSAFPAEKGGISDMIFKMYTQTLDRLAPKQKMSF